MQCEQHLALKAILIGLRRSGVLDKRAIKSIVEALEETSAKARSHCPESADSLQQLAATLAEGPARNCLVSVAA